MKPRLLAGVAAAAALLVLASCGGSGDPRPDLVFVSTRDGDYALYAMDADGSREKRIVERTGGSTSSGGSTFFEVEPAWSSDGTRIAFSSARRGSFDVYAMRPDGTGLRRLTATKDDDHRPSFSPDGERIVFSRGSPSALHVMDADGGKVVKISSGMAEESDPAWSSDGEWIAFVRRMPGTDIREVWVVRPDGTGRRRLTSLGAASYTPAWSPDAKRIVFTSNARELRFEIYSVGVEGGDVQRITRSSEDAFDPAWSPDGALIAFSRGGAIMTIDPRGEEDRLTSEEDNDSSPVWNPVPPPSDE